MLKGHGDDIYSQKRAIVSNFSSNVNAHQNLLALQAHLCSCIQYIHSYPEPDAGSLVKLLADKYKIDNENICITNGATEAIYLIAQALSGSKTSIIVPTFSEYEDACTIHKHDLNFIHKLEEMKPDCQTVWLCNPNNPTGLVYDKEQLKETINRHPNTCFIIDQSYEYFTNNPVLNIKESISYQNVILLHSMTKHHAIPGLRLGYLTAHNNIVELINNYRMPWSVNQLAIEAGKYLVQNNKDDKTINHLLLETERLQGEIRNIGITVYPTDTHFFLCKLKNRKASDLKKYLVDKYAILIRDAANFRGLNEHYFRIATQSEEENDRLTKAIAEWI